MVMVNDQVLIIFPTTYSGWAKRTVAALHQEEMIVDGLVDDVGTHQVVVPADS